MAAEAAERLVCREERQERPLTLAEIAAVGVWSPLPSLRYVASARKWPACRPLRGFLGTYLKNHDNLWSSEIRLAFYINSSISLSFPRCRDIKHKRNAAEAGIVMQRYIRLSSSEARSQVRCRKYKLNISTQNMPL